MNSRLESTRGDLFIQSDALAQGRRAQRWNPLCVVHMPYKAPLNHILYAHKNFCKLFCAIHPLAAPLEPKQTLPLPENPYLPCPCTGYSALLQHITLHHKAISISYKDVLYRALQTNCSRPSIGHPEATITDDPFKFLLHTLHLFIIR